MKFLQTTFRREMNNTSSSSDLLLQKRRDKFNDWKVRFVEKYGNEPSLNDIEKYPKVSKSAVQHVLRRCLDE